MLPGTIRFVGRVLRGLIAATVLLALVAGLPWALWHFVGWPLPSHVPTWAEVQGALLGPMTTTFLLNFLVCICWIAWAAFSLDVLRCTADAARGLQVDFSAAGPMHALVGVLVGAVLLSVVGHRATPASAALLPTAILTTSTTDGAAVHFQSVVVRGPQNGVYDSLSRIAQRTLGNAGRWPEIFDLNYGKPQPHGGSFTNANLVYPGEELTLPADASVPAQAPQGPSLPSPTFPMPTSATPTIPDPPPSSEPASPALSMPLTHGALPRMTTNSRPPVMREPAFRSGPELFVGFGLAAAVSAALVVARRRCRARYRPGSGDRDDLPVAPVVYQLRLAHLRAGQDDEFGDAGSPQRPSLPPAFVVGAPVTKSAKRPTLVVGLGVQDGREIALDLAAVRGLGLVGVGAPAAARALLVAMLTASAGRPAAPPQPSGISMIVPANDLLGVLGRGVAHADLPAALRVVADLAEALDVLEAETLVRAMASHDQNPGSVVWPALVLVARPPEHHQRLQAVLDNGAPFGITGLLLGQWQPGVTCYVRKDGTVSATGPGVGEALRGARLFHLGGDATTELLTLLYQAEPDPSAASGDVEPAADTGLEILEPSRPATPSARERTTTAAELTPNVAGAEYTITARAPITVAVLGGLRVHWHSGSTTDSTELQRREITGALQPRTQELVVLLALHPHGTTREMLVSTLWGQDPPARPTNALHTALSRMRRDLAAATDGAVTDIAVVGNGHYQLDPALVQVDYWRFEDAVSARRAASTDQARIDAYREVVDSYGGPLADGMSKIEWIEPAREAIRRDAIDAVAGLARALVKSDPQQTLDLLEIARAFDPHNELLYRDIMRLQERLGQFDAIPRTLALLSTRLAEVDDEPTPQTRGLAVRLAQRYDDHPLSQRVLRPEASMLNAPPSEEVVEQTGSGELIPHRADSL